MVEDIATLLLQKRVKNFTQFLKRLPSMIPWKKLASFYPGDKDELGKITSTLGLIKGGLQWDHFYGFFMALSLSFKTKIFLGFDRACVEDLPSHHKICLAFGR